MADSPEDNTKSEETSPHPTSNADLQTPIDLPELNTPTSTSSLIFSLRNCPPRLTATDKTVASGTTPSTPAMDPLRYVRSDFEAWTPSPNVYNKPQPETPEKSKTTRAIGIARAIDAGKRVQRIMGVSEPVPFVTPPAMPKDLEQEFVAGMEEYGLNKRMQNMGLDALSQAASMQERMPEIKEENESPIRAALTPPSLVKRWKYLAVPLCRCLMRKARPAKTLESLPVTSLTTSSCLLLILLPECQMLILKHS
jgi:hypothetical protein